MDIKTFQSLSTQEVAKLVRAAGSKVCVFPINGTRRWFMLEHLDLLEGGSPVEAFVEVLSLRLLEICKLFFDHGVDTVLAPVIGPDIIERGSSYDPIGVSGLLWFAQDQQALDFYTANDIRVRMYGDASRYCKDTAYACAIPAFGELAQQTAHHQAHRLFFGVCAHDATENVAQIGVEFHQKYGRLPNKKEITEAYYGEFVESVDIFIGSGQPAVFDMPLITTGNEDLYFTVVPSAYLDTQMLRSILYDHLYVRPSDEPDYDDVLSEDWYHMADFFARNRQAVLGLGHRYNGNAFWYPLPQIK